VPGGSTDADALNLTAIKRLAPGYCAYIYIDVGTIFAIFGYICRLMKKNRLAGPALRKVRATVMSAVLPAAQAEGARPALAVADDVNLGRSPAARAADGLRRRASFPPAAAWRKRWPTPCVSC
jgi:hypothetical protein